ncbi:unnamed protein product [Mytilus coruscus]|uniref:Uncharacterized protein n=1 Tax=Mytilus coruscus TaxID=42192 RepID=A0A6J8D074_MYTCO|nr:unnamed protein product [Mytilus coruscus]
MDVVMDKDVFHKHKPCMIDMDVLMHKDVFHKHKPCIIDMDIVMRKDVFHKHKPCIIDMDIVMHKDVFHKHKPCIIDIDRVMHKDVFHKHKPCIINGLQLVTTYRRDILKSSPKSAFASSIINSLYSSSLHLGYLSTNVPPQSIVESTVFRQQRVSIYAQSNTVHLILQSCVTSGLLSDHTRKHLVSASFKTV